MSGPFYEAPFCSYPLGVQWSKKIVCFDPSQIEWPNLIHEMGHVFVSTKNPNQSSEYEWFGWEYVVAKYIRGPMKEWWEVNADYQVGDEGGIGLEEIQYLTTSQRRKLIKLRLDAALKKAIIKREGSRLVPLAIR